MHAEYDEKRFSALAEYKILDTPKEQDFDDIVMLAAEICGTPVSLISLIDQDRQWFKAETGAGIRETPLNQSMCRKLMHHNEVSIVHDASRDDRFTDNTLVTGDFHLRFYAGAPLTASDGTPIGMLCVLDTQPRDLTDHQKNMLQMLARQVMIQFNLRKALRDKTQMAVELTKQRNISDAANIAKTEFLAHTSHEIRTPLGAVIGLTQLLEKSSPLTDHQKKLIDTLSTSAQSLMSLVNDTLDISKIEAQEMELENISFQPVKIVRDVIDMMRTKATENNVTLTMTAKIADNLDFIGDPARFRQIILNLCSNAIKFSPGGTVDVSIDSRKKDYSNYDDIIVDVTDSGIGIEADKIETIFHKFTQEDASISRKYGGTGLGLSISRRIAEAMGGTILVKSVKGQGSCFTCVVALQPLVTDIAENIPQRKIA